MSQDHSHDDVSKHIKTYLLIGLFLLIGTGLTVWAATNHFGSHSMNIAIALLIAVAKGSLVALFFMHLISEKTAIYMFMSVTVFFVTGLMVLTLWASHDHPTATHFIRLVNTH